MAKTLAAPRAADVRAALAARYPFDIDTAARVASPRTPGVTPPPGGGVPGRTPSVTPPANVFPGPRALAKPPMWVRAFHRLANGVTPNAINEYNALGADAVARWDAMVDRQLAWEDIDDAAMAARLASANYTTLGKSLTQLWTEHVTSDPEWQVRMRPAWEVQRGAIARAVHSKRQLLERVVTFWHDHFNVQVNDYDAGPVYVHYHRDVIRANATGNFRTMLEAVAKSTAMLFYLDNRSNTRAGPNENFARELLELHTFGAENYLGFMDPEDVPDCPEDTSLPIGYTDLDVYETAACFTGWGVNYTTGEFAYTASNHDTGLKYVLRMVIPPEQPPLTDGQRLLDRIARHPRVAKFICAKLIRHFADDTPPQALVDSAAAVFLAEREADDQIRKVLAHILKSPFVRDGWGGKRRRPTEATVAALRAGGGDWTLAFTDRAEEFMWRLGGTGHLPYDWPSPNGYPDLAEAWSGANSFVMTWRMLYWLTNTSDGTVRPLPVVEATRAGVPQWTARALVDFWTRRILGRAPAAARQQQLLAFMAQNGDPDTFVIADTNDWNMGDLKRHYNHGRLRTMVAMLLVSPEFLQR